MIAKRNNPIAMAAPTTAATITPTDWTTTPTKSTLGDGPGPVYHPQRTPTTRPPTSSPTPDRKSTRLNSSHTVISYAVFCLKKKKKKKNKHTSKKKKNNT